MVTEDKVVKVIDFGICKINDMINSATVFTLGTNAYSAQKYISIVRMRQKRVTCILLVQ